MSLFDPPRPQLNPRIWDRSGTLLPHVKEYILELLKQVFPEDKLNSLVMIGSSVGHQYGDSSDIDINVMARKGEEFDAWHTIFKDFNNRKNFLPGTQHPINFFFQEYTMGEDWSNSLGAYNILTDEWVKRPIPYDKLGDPDEKFGQVIAYGNMLLGMVDTEVQQIKAEQARGQEDEVRRRIRDLAIMFKRIEDNRKVAYKYHTGTPALQECNILYKIFDDSQYSELFHELINVYDDEFSFAKQAGKLKEDWTYGKYVTKHKANIISPMLQMHLPITQALAHDLSKYRPSEFKPYRDWFVGKKGLHGTHDDDTYKKWREAVSLHYGRNMHHWRKRGLDWRDVPLKYRMESVADWYSVGKTNRPKGTKFPSFKEWYSEREKGLPVDPGARNEIDIQLGLRKKADYIMEKTAWAVERITKE